MELVLRAVARAPVRVLGRAAVASEGAGPGDVTGLPASGSLGLRGGGLALPGGTRAPRIGRGVVVRGRRRRGSGVEGERVAGAAWPPNPASDSGSASPGGRMAWVGEGPWRSEGRSEGSSADRAIRCFGYAGGKDAGMGDGSDVSVEIFFGEFHPGRRARWRARSWRRTRGDVTGLPR